MCPRFVPFAAFYLLVSLVCVLTKPGHDFHRIDGTVKLSVLSDLETGYVEADISGGKHGIGGEDELGSFVQLSGGEFGAYFSEVVEASELYF